MESNFKTQTIVTLRLDESEAAWLRTVMQNYLFGEPESESDKEMRHRFWNALTPPPVAG